MKKYGIRGTFNINSGIFKDSPNDYRKGNRMTREETVKTFKDSGMEIAVHGLYHDHMTTNPSVMTAYDFFTERENLEEMFGTIVRGMAYPFGTYNDDVVDVAKMCGIAYSRTVEAHHKFTVPTDWLRMGTTCHHADEKAFELAEQFIAGEPSNVRFRYEGWLFYIWGHSYEFRTEEDWLRMDGLLSMLSNRDDVWYATNIEIYDYVEAYRSLCYSVDLSSVYNPSSKDIWLVHEGKVVMIPSNSEVKF
jgi:hypothetical protein